MSGLYVRVKVIMTPDELRATLRDLEFTQERLARELGKTDRQVRRWLSGEAPIPKWLVSWLDMYRKVRREAQGPA